MVIRTNEEIQQAISQLNERRQHPALKQPANAEVKAGLREALRVLCDLDEDLHHIANNLTSVQARCIAWLAVDYLQGACNAECFINIPLRLEEGLEDAQQ